MLRFQKLPATLALAAALLLPAFLHAQTISVDLSQEVAAVNQPVVLNIVVTNGNVTQLPAQVTGDGLDIRFIGSSNRVEINNFKRVDTAIYSYQVTPLRTGDLIIPSILVKMGTKSYQTKTLKLRVGGNSGGVPVLPALPAGPGRPTSPYGNPYGQPQIQQQRVPQPQPQQQQQQQAPDPDRIIFGELVIPKKTAYVGEVIPVELRFYFAADVPVQQPEMPNFSGDGFTVMNFSKPTLREQEVEGVAYNVIVFQTAITPAKAGELEISPAALRAQVSVPMQTPQGMDDFISSFFANSGFGMQLREIEVKTKGSRLTVKPLPAEGRPDDFSGAIGQFTLRATASPKTAAAGDPISLDVTVAGRGNFDAMGAPTLQDSEAWKSYPPNESFRASPSDPIGYNGEKTFKYMIVARTDTNTTPTPEFSFFDPAVEKYVTLRAGPVAVTAKGGSAAASSAATTTSAPAATPTPAPSVAPTPTPPADLLAKVRPASFEPFALSRGFLMGNVVAALLWIILGLVGIVRAFTRSDYARRSHQRRENQKLLHRAQDPSLSAEEFFPVAADFVRSRLAPDGSSSDTSELVAAADLTPETREGILAILNHGDAWRYSAGSSSRLGAEERQQLLAYLKAFDEEVR